MPWLRWTRGAGIPKVEPGLYPTMPPGQGPAVYSGREQATIPFAQKHGSAEAAPPPPHGVGMNSRGQNSNVHSHGTCISLFRPQELFTSSGIRSPQYLGRRTWPVWSISGYDQRFLPPSYVSDIVGAVPRVRDCKLRWEKQCSTSRGFGDETAMYKVMMASFENERGQHGRHSCIFKPHPAST